MPPSMTVRVLVVDDDQDDCRLIRDLLVESTRADFVVDEAHSAQQGFYKLQQTHHRYDVILLDYKLPDSDGISFLQKLQELHFSTPVIIVTSHRDRTLQGHAIERGAVEYLEKGTFGTVLLERTCLYAIGVQEKRRQNGQGAPGVGILIEQLVGLTRQSVQAQTESSREIKELRRDFAHGMERHSNDSKEQHDKILSAIKSPWKVFLDWITVHPIVAMAIFLCLILSIIVGVLLVDILDVDKIKDLTEIKTSLLTVWTNAS